MTQKLPRHSGYEPAVRQIQGAYAPRSSQAQTGYQPNAQSSAHDRQQAWLNLKAEANGQWQYIFSQLAPTLAEALERFPRHVACPVHGGINGYRLFRHFNETGRGVCNTCGVQSSGFDTLAWANGYEFRDAVREVAKLLNGESIVAKSHRAAPPPPPEPVIDWDKRLYWLQRTLVEANPLAGSPAERYLLNRGIPASSIPGTLYAHRGLDYFEPGNQTPLGNFPCLLAPITNAAGELVSVHRIFLDEFGNKATVPAPKKMMPTAGMLGGSAIKLFTFGEEGDTGAPGEVLCVAEGIETALAVHALSGLPTWACTTAGLLETVEVPDHVKEVHIWADLDVSQRGAQAAEKLKRRMVSEGRRVIVHMPEGRIPDGKKGVDWLDVLVAGQKAG